MSPALVNGHRVPHHLLNMSLYGFNILMAASNAAQSDQEELLCILYNSFCVSIPDSSREPYPYCIYVVTRFEILLLIDLRNNGH